jgi:hypothetical protein
MTDGMGVDDQFAMRKIWIIHVSKSYRQFRNSRSVRAGDPACFGHAWPSDAAPQKGHEMLKAGSFATPRCKEAGRTLWSAVTGPRFPRMIAGAAPERSFANDRSGDRTRGRESPLYRQGGLVFQFIQEYCLESVIRISRSGSAPMRRPAP